MLIFVCFSSISELLQSWQILGAAMSALFVLFAY